MAADEVDPQTIDAVIIPGGYAPGLMRRSPEMVNLVREAFLRGKTVAAICHAGWMLVSAGIVKNRTVTSFFFHPGRHDPCRGELDGPRGRR